MRKTLAIAIPAYERTSGIELNILSNIDFFLENDIPIHMDITNYMGIEIDTPQDIDRAIEFMNKHNLK